MPRLGVVLTLVLVTLGELVDLLIEGEALRGVLLRFLLCVSLQSICDKQLIYIIYLFNVYPLIKLLNLMSYQNYIQITIRM